MLNLDEMKAAMEQAKHMPHRGVLELRELLTKATPLPWRECGAGREKGCSCGLVWSTSSDVVVATVTREDDDHKKSEQAFQADAALIAAAVTALPLLLDVVAFAESVVDAACAERIGAAFGLRDALLRLRPTEAIEKGDES